MGMLLYLRIIYTLAEIGLLVMSIVNFCSPTKPQLVILVRTDFKCVRFKCPKTSNLMLFVKAILSLQQLARCLSFTQPLRDFSSFYSTKLLNLSLYFPPQDGIDYLDILTVFLQYQL